MIITISGIKRSASTVQFNIVRLILERDYDVQVFGEPYCDFEPGDKVHLVKQHRYDRHLAEKADHVFLTNRNFNDVKDSLERFSEEEAGWHRICEFYKWLTLWSLHSDPAHYFEYARWKSDPLGWVRRHIRLLGSDANPSDILKQVKALKPPKQGQDPKTLLFHNHITS